MAELEKAKKVDANGNAKADLTTVRRGKMDGDMNQDLQARRDWNHNVELLPYKKLGLHLVGSPIVSSASGILANSATHFSLEVAVVVRQSSPIVLLISLC